MTDEPKHPPELFARIRTLAREGVPTREIARLCEAMTPRPLTRNAVIGIIHRNRMRPNAMPKPPPKLPVDNSKKPAASKRSKPKLEPRLKPPSPRRLKGPRGIYDLGACHCRWPLGRTYEPAKLFCAAIVTTAPYCEEHRLQAYQRR